MALYDIAEKFINHLNSLERFIDYDNIIRERYLNDDSEKLDLNDLIGIILDIKSIEFSGRIELDENEQYKKDILDEVIDKNKFIKYIYNHIEYSDENGESIISFTSELVGKIISDQLATRKNFHTDMTQLKNSIIISLVTSLELLIAELFKDFIENLDQSDFLSKRSISYKDLLKIGDVQEARRFLLDQYIEEILRSSFIDWIQEINDKMKINLSKVNIIEQSNDISLINETFQRRHLFIHNDGIINDLYLTKVDKDLTNGLEKNEKIENSESYILERIKLFKKVGIILVFLYAKKRYRGRMDAFFNDFNDLLLDTSSKGCIGARFIYKEISNDSNYNHSSQLMSTFNYFLAFKLNGEFEEVRKELEDYYVDTLSVEYRMAKHILLDDFNEAFTCFETYVNSISDDVFFHIIDWPLINLVKNREEFKNFITNKIDSIITEEGSNNVEELTYN